MNSSLYQCRIFHKRLKPVTRQFAYSVFMMSIDLDELDQLNKKLWLFSRNRWNIYSIKDADYLTQDSSLNIKEKLFAFLKTKNINTNNIAKTILQTFPRIFGYQFNPVSFYYLENSSGKTIATVAEVGNTFLEKKLFLIDQNHKPDWFRLITAKNFYVSPFSKVNDHFDFQIGPKKQTWAVNINDLDQDGIVLVSTIRGKQKTLTSLRLAYYIIRYPLLTARIIFLIHWHALIMWLRKLPISNKSNTAADQTNVLRPHKSLTKNNHG